MENISTVQRRNVMVQKQIVGNELFVNVYCINVIQYLSPTNEIGVARPLLTEFKHGFSCYPSAPCFILTMLGFCIDRLHESLKEDDNAAAAFTKFVLDAAQTGVRIHHFSDLVIEASH